METVGYVSVMLILLSRTCPVSCSDVVSDGDRIDDMEDDMLVMKMDINRIEENILTDKISQGRELRQQIRKQVRAAMSEMFQDGSLKDMMSGQLQMRQTRQMKHNYHQMKRQLIQVTKSFQDFRDETSVFKEAILKGGNPSSSSCKDMARLEMELKQKNVDIKHMKAESKNLTQELAQIKAARESLNCTVNNADASTSMPQLMSTQQPSRNECTKMEVPNFSFETTGNWLNYGVGWTTDDTQAQDGGRSAKVTSGGAYQEFVFPSPVRKFIISGYSKNVGGRNSITTPSDYSLYCDLKKPSGSFLWGHISTFTPGRSIWHRVQVNVSLSKVDAVVMARCHLLYRNSASVGAAYFDNVSLYRLSDDVTDFTQCQIDTLKVSPQPSSGECTKMAVPNFSFETTGNWLNYGEGWTPDDTQAQDGGRSAKVTSGGAYQEFVFPSPVRKFIISGYSKNVGGRNSITTPSDYSLYCDLKKPSGSFLWGHIATFTPGRSIWHRVQVNVNLSKVDAVVMARCHLLYRNSASVGAAYFDNVSLYRLSDDVTDFTQCQIDTLKVSPQPSSSECTKMAVPNFSFETTGNWLNYGVGWTPDDTQAQDGGRSVKVTSGGAYQEFVFPSPVRKFIISGYSKNVGGRSSITTPSDYSLYCDLKKPSGSFLWGHIATFTPGRSTWHRVQVNVSLSKTDAVVMARCYLLYRNSASVGAAYFDNVSLYRLSDAVTDFTKCQMNK
ncbi:uncharacterized protein [Haliotis cracherodii]|uniref:uncharacterized protein n=1 Tax=Haliotis cracherodii TaxID=6455 RepID=UPI0039EC8F1C